MTMEKKLTPKDLKDILQLSLATISRMTARGQLPSILIVSGRRKKIYRYDEQAIEQWLRQRSQGGPARAGRRIANGDTMVTTGNKAAKLLIPKDEHRFDRPEGNEIEGAP